MLFADVVQSMDIAAAVGAERLCEIMAELLDRSTAVVKRFGGRPRPRRCGLRLRVGLNSGQVIAGDSGSAFFGYTAIGEQVGGLEIDDIRESRKSVAVPTWKRAVCDILCGCPRGCRRRGL